MSLECLVEASISSHVRTVVCRLFSLACLFFSQDVIILHYIRRKVALTVCEVIVVDCVLAEGGVGGAQVDLVVRRLRDPVLLGLGGLCLEREEEKK